LTESLSRVVCPPLVSAVAFFRSGVAYGWKVASTEDIQASWDSHTKKR
jgi:hypothetical protein